MDILSDELPQKRWEKPRTTGQISVLLPSGSLIGP